ncbi:DNA invertase Pin-like site-specific DNA recombinase [Bosea sp. 124]|nr:DNA invertase Pin-like site-specific DNA recombinase [Bosea sp. 124]
MRKIGYLRVSTDEQRPDRQIEGLRGLCDEIHIEVVSATSKRRPVYERVKRRLRSGDCLVVWDFDRAWRSTIDALTETKRFRAKGIGFRLASLSILDTASPAGIFILTMLGAMSELERNTLSLRTREGLAAARKRGVRLGRPPKLDAAQLDQARALLPNSTMACVAQLFDVAPWTLSRSLRRGIKTQKACGVSPESDHHGARSSGSSISSGDGDRRNSS